MFYVKDLIFHTLEDFSVRFSETDAAGLVHFTNFLRWAENAEGDFFRKYDLCLLEKNSAETLCGFPRVSVRIDYRAPARYADCIRVKIRPQELPEENSRSLNWEFQIFRIESDRTEKLLALGSWSTVFAEIDFHGNTRAGKSVPAQVRNAIKTFLQKSKFPA